MNCTRCGYLMDDFDDGCPRCHEPRLPSAPEPPLPQVGLWKQRMLNLVLLTIACSLSFQGWKWTQQESIQEAAIRFYAAPADKRRPPSGFPQTLFVQIDEHDPSPSLLARFGSDALKVRAFSRGHWEQASLGLLVAKFVDVQGQEIGMPLRFSALKWHGPFEVELSADSPFMGQNFVLRYQNGRWGGVRKSITGIA